MLTLEMSLRVTQWLRETNQKELHRFGEPEPPPKPPIAEEHNRTDHQPTG